VLRPQLLVGTAEGSAHDVPEVPGVTDPDQSSAPPAREGAEVVELSSPRISEPLPPSSVSPT